MDSSPQEELRALKLVSAMAKQCNYIFTWCTAAQKHTHKANIVKEASVKL